MALAFLIVGLILVVAAWKNKLGELFGLILDDFTGAGNFFYWILAIGFIAMIGLNKTIRPVSDALLGLVVLVIIVSNGQKGLFQKFGAEIDKGTKG